MALLDEDCLRPGKVRINFCLSNVIDAICPKVTDLTYLQKLDKHWVGHPHYESRGCKEFRSDVTLKSHFRLVHYAGKVNFSPLL